MGRPIVYCQGCGNNLREDDFDRGRARMIENRPFCSECRPLKDGENEAAQRRASSGKVPAPPPRKTATDRVPMASPGARRPAAPVQGSNPLPLIAGVGGVALLILIFAVTQSSGGTPRPPAPPPSQAPPLVIDIPKPKPPVDPPPPPPPPPIRDVPPPPPPPKRDPPTGGTKPSDPLVVPTAAEKFEAFLNQIKQMIQDDQRKERSSEILNMFAAAAKLAGPRATEVERMKNEYLNTLDEPTRRAAIWSEWRITTSAEVGSSGLLASYGDRNSVMMTHPPDRNTPARLERTVDVPSGKKTTLSFWVAPHQTGDFELRVYVDEKEVLKEIVGPKGSGWREKKIDLSLHAGKRVAIRLENAANNWEWEHGYWSDPLVTSE